MIEEHLVKIRAYLQDVNMMLVNQIVVVTRTIFQALLFKPKAMKSVSGGQSAFDLGAKWA